MRRRSPALRHGGFAQLALPDGLVGYRRTAPDGDLVILVNFIDADTTVPTVPDVGLDFGGASGTTANGNGPMVALSSDGVGEGRPFGGRLRPDQAVVLTRPADRN
jgi:hypothetical protein